LTTRLGRKLRSTRAMRKCLSNTRVVEEPTSQCLSEQLGKESDMDEQHKQNINQATEQLTDSTQQVFRMLANRTISFQQSNLRLTQNFLGNWMEQVNNLTQGTREAMQNLQEQGQRQREAVETLSEEGTNAYSGFLNSALGFYQEALNTANQVGQQNIQQGEQATQQALLAASQAASEGVQQAIEAVNQAGQQTAQAISEAGQQGAEADNQSAQQTARGAEQTGQQAAQETRRGSRSSS
jgi:hypothetical protein